MIPSIQKLLLTVASIICFSTLLSAQKPCFDDCWKRMAVSSSHLAPLEILKELEGCQAPDFNVKSIDDEVISLKAYPKSVIVMNFWFVGCKPCIEEMPRLNELVDLYAGKEIVFLSFSRDSKEDIESKFLPRHQFKYKIVAGKLDIIEKHCVQVYPSHLVLDKSGKVELAAFETVAKDKFYELLKKSIDSALAKQ